MTGLFFPYIPSKVRKLTEHPAFLRFEKEGGLELPLVDREKEEK